LGRDVRRLPARERQRYEVYYYLASEFGWDKKKVDRQPAKYIYRLLDMAAEQNKKAEREQRVTSNQMKKFK
jgi:hypothetical protein